VYVIQAAIANDKVLSLLCIIIPPAYAATDISAILSRSTETKNWNCYSELLMNKLLKENKKNFKFHDMDRLVRVVDRGEKRRHNNGITKSISPLPDQFR
jgi:hypothetical protein